MPELPEVETVRKSLESVLIGKKILKGHVTYQGLLKNIDKDAFLAVLQNKIIRQIRRRGKYLLFMLSDEWTLVFHLRMTGQLIFCEKERAISKHTHVRLELDGKKELRFADIRKFGMIYLEKSGLIHNLKGLAALGPEPLEEDFTIHYLKERLKGKKGSIKSFLLDQGQIAGIGNIYADEILFKAGLNPEKEGLSLSNEEISKLYVAVRYCLQKGIDNRGTSFRDYVDGRGEKGNMQEELQVYGRGGLPCKLCGDTLIKTRTAGRGTVFCPTCQRDES